MKEVRNMHAHLIAHPLGGAWAVTCSEHGAMGVVTDAEIDMFLATHMIDHGAVGANA